MKQKRMGRTGLMVSEVSLGTMTFGNQCDEPTSHAIMDLAAERGITFIDTADAYPIPTSIATVGITEEYIGRWLKRRRDAYVLATKCHIETGPGANDRGNSRRHIIAAVNDSLRRLQTDYIDLLYIHKWDAATPIDETLEAFDTLRRSGKIRYGGCSNVLGHQLMASLWESDKRNIARFDAVQPRYNLLYRELERELLAAAFEHGVGVITYNPLAGGLLTGKYSSGTTMPKEGRFTLGASGDLYRARYFQDAQVEIAKNLAEDVKSRGKSITQVALRWVLDRPEVTSAIIGATSVAQLADSLGGVDLVLDEADRAACDSAWWAVPRRPPEDER